jgi:hypothetical protein
MEIYPNPTNDQLQVKSNMLLQGLTVVDVYGSVRQSINESKLAYELDVTSLPTGIYFLIVRQGGTNSSVKFVKER